MKFIRGAFAHATVKRLAKTNNGRTTVLGVVAAGLLAEKIDWGLLMAGDANQIGQAVGAMVVGLLGYLTNRPDTDGDGVPG